MKSIITLLLMLTISNKSIAHATQINGVGVCDNYNDIYYPNYKNVFECAKKRATINAQKKCEDGDVYKISDWKITHDRACDYCPIIYVKAKVKFICLHNM